MVEREREHAAGLLVEENGAARTVRGTPVTLPGRLPYLASSDERLVGTARTGYAVPTERRADKPSIKTGSETVVFRTSRAELSGPSKHPLT